MNFSTILKGAAVAASFALVVSEASAQLPVRTQSLQLLSGTGTNALTQRAAAATVSYSVTWPAAVHADATNAYLSSASAGGNSTLSWVEIDGNLIDGSGVGGQVAYFDDANTITSSPTMTFDGAGNLDLGGAAAGTLILGSSGTGNPNVTLSSNSTNVATFNLPSYGGSSGPFNVVATTNTGTVNQIPVVQTDGTIQWVDNPTAGLKSGVVTPAANAYSAAVTFTTAYAATPVVTVSAVGPVANGYILQVTSVTTTGFTVLSSAPFDGTDTISWIANSPFNP